MKKFTMAAILFFVPVSMANPEEPFLAEKAELDGVAVVRLADAARGIEVSILPAAGNIAFEMKIHGKNILFFPAVKLPDFLKRPMPIGIPILAPWANRMDGPGFWANGKRYDFDMNAGNISKDGRGLPIHGLLSGSVWEVVRVASDTNSASVTSRFDFAGHPGLMAQWPFAHSYEMTYHLQDGALEVRTTVLNAGDKAMPLALGFHPYFRIPDVPRDEWFLHMPARAAVIADDRLIPTGEFKPVDLPNPLPLKGRTLDDGFTDLRRDAKGLARFAIQSGSKEIELLFGPKYPVAVVWEPALTPGQTQGFICVEPMTGVTNAINLHHAGKYPDLQVIPPGGKWTESFWIRPKGF